MTRSARIAAAIDLPETIAAGRADAVTNAFFRARRFIGSGGRRAVSARVWAVLRARRRYYASPERQDWGRFVRRRGFRLQ
jgi:16S rRNA (cytosine967-C5)-methyltransferase